jgi:hypothetical protein
MPRVSIFHLAGCSTLAAGATLNISAPRLLRIEVSTMIRAELFTVTRLDFNETHCYREIIGDPFLSQPVGHRTISDIRDEFNLKLCTCSVKLR